MAESKDYDEIGGMKFAKGMSDADIAFVLNQKATSKPQVQRPQMDQPEPLLARKRAAGEKSLEEGKDVALKALPLAGAVVASHLTGAGEAADVALLASRFGPAMGQLIGLALRGSTAALGAAGGSMIESGLRGKSLMAASHEAADTAKGYFEGQMVGEGAIGTVKALVPKAVSVSRMLPGGKYAENVVQAKRAAAQAASRAAVVEEGQAVTKEFMQSIRPTEVDPIAAGNEASQAVNSFDVAFEKKATDMRDAAKRVGKGVATDVQSLREPILKIERQRSKTTEPLIGEFTSPSTEYSDVVRKAREGQQSATVVPVTSPIVTETGDPITRLQAIIKEKKLAPLDLVMDARGAISKRAFEPSTPKDVKKVYDALLGPIDNLITTRMDQVREGSSSLWDAQVNFYAAKENIRSDSLYKLATSQPEKLADYIVSGNPREATKRVAHIKLMAREAGMPNVVEDVQHQWLTKLVTGKDGSVDLRGFDAKVKAFGDSTVDALFATPAERASLTRMREISGKTDEMFNQPTIKATQQKMSLIYLLKQASYTMIPTAGVGMMSGHGPAALAGVGVGGYIAPALVVRIAESEAASKAFNRVMDKIKLNPSDPKAVMDMVRTLKLATQSVGAVRKTAQGLQEEQDAAQTR